MDFYFDSASKNITGGILPLDRDNWLKKK